MDQDVGSSVNTRFLRTPPALYAWGLKPTNANFQVTYIYTYTAAHEALKYFTGKSINTTFIIISIAFTIRIHVT